ncbi:amidase [Paraburkholderia sp. Ac-20342]|uniref:amidase n=1 Tax=Paraburkholderia sp. Ac-20342 TaxID=2703889 RepID=UPI001F11C619|nr:amidase [Paraburkholderia sp. Ac-20342]
MVTSHNAMVSDETTRAPGLRDALTALRSARATSRELTESALERAEYSRKQFNAFSVIDWDHALRAASESDRRYAAGQPRPLEGMPIAVKDLIDTRGIETRYGSPAYLGHIPDADADIVRTLVEKGAIVIGKTTTHEFAWGVTTSSTAFGDTLNPLDTHRIPGGSSGGAAAAIAAGAVAAGLGTDTGGSVRIPAALCGVAGFKPTLGKLSTRGIFPLAPSVDHPGFLGRNVDDILILAGASNIDICESDAWLSARLGVIHSIPPVPLSAEVATAFEHAVGKLSGVFAMEHVETKTLFDGVYDSFATIVLTEGSIEHLRRNPLSRIAAGYGAETQERLAMAQDRTIRGYADAQQTRHAFIQRLHAALATVDYLLLPTCPCVAPLTGMQTLSIGAWSGTVRQALMNYTAPFNVSGFPAISIPLASPTDSLPVAMQIVARPGDDGALLKVASEVECILGGVR